VKQTKDQEDCCKSNKNKIEIGQKNYICKLGGASEPQDPPSYGPVLPYCFGT